MTIQLEYKRLVAALYDLYSDREATNIADWVMEHVTGLPKIERILNKQFPLNPQQLAQLTDIKTSLLQHKPVQYVLNHTYFANMRLYVNQNVLIPRPETEELVQWVVTDVNNIWPRKAERLCLIDVGTGSGNIALALKKQLPAYDVVAVDVSDAALDVAKKNASTLALSITFYQLDVLDSNQRKRLPKFDVIVSNPPYITQSEAAKMNRNVLDFEPHLALFVADNDPLIFYNALADMALELLTADGHIYVEINETLANEVAQLFSAKGLLQTTIKQDMQQKNRMVKAGRGQGKPDANNC